MMYVSLFYCFAISLMKCIWKRTRNISLSISIFRSFISSLCKTSKTASNSGRMMVITSPAHYPTFTHHLQTHRSTFTHSLPILCHPLTNHDPLPAYLSPIHPLPTLYPPIILCSLFTISTLTNRLPPFNSSFTLYPSSANPLPLYPPFHQTTTHPSPTHHPSFAPPLPIRFSVISHSRCA